jgi:PAS domain S-box-containing protein
MPFAGDRAIAWSDDAKRMLGIGKDFATSDGLSLFDPGDLERLEESIAAVESDGMPFVATCRVTALDGRRLWMNIMGEPSLDDSRRIVGVRGAIQDVTAWKEAEATAEAQRSRFAHFASAVPAIIWSADSSGSVDYFNHAVVEYSGHATEDLVADQWLSIVHPDDVERCVARWQHSVTTGDPYEISFRLRDFEGRYRWFHVRAQAERDDAGEVLRWWGSGIDVHELTTLEDEANTLAEERNEILESIGDGVFTLDADLRFTYLNSNAETMLRRPASELLGQSLWDAFPETRGSEVERAFTEARDSGTIQRFEHYNPAMEVWFETSASYSPRGLTVFFRDVTELKSVREQLEQAQRMESVGRLTGGIAHDFNNLLTVIVGAAEELSDDAAIADGSREMVGLIADAASRGAELTHQLLAFSRRQPLAPQPVDVSDHVRRALSLLAHAVGGGVEVESRLAEDLPPARVDPSQLENALLNLAINASDAMPDGGTLTVETSLAELDESYSTPFAEVRPGSYVLMTVRDTGAGIPQETLPHVFEPFFTTKSAAQGSGLGLAMVWGFAQQTGGAVTVYSEVDIGTTFHVYLPIADANEALAPAPPPERVSTAPRSGRILLVEDDPLVRTFAAERLQNSGYEVMVAESGVHALRILGGIDDLTLLLTDVIMVGGVSGRDVADAVLERFPGVPVLFASGYSKEVIDHHGRLDPDVTLISKPYTGKQLIARVDAMVARDAENGEEAP